MKIFGSTSSSVFGFTNTRKMDTNFWNWVLYCNVHFIIYYMYTKLLLTLWIIPIENMTSIMLSNN